jgi:hypothetical protein
MMFSIYCGILFFILNSTVYLKKRKLFLPNFYFLPSSLIKQCLSEHLVVRARITYAILVWGHSAHLRKVFNQQRRCIRVLGGLGYRDDCRDIFKTFKILTVPCIPGVELVYET